MTQRQRGFTLVELMMVVAIIGVLSAVMFGMSTRPYNANAQVIADQVASTFSYARTRAVSTRKVHKVRIYTATTGEQAMELSAASLTGMAYGTSTIWQAIEVKRIPSGVAIWSAVAGVAAANANPAQDTALDYELYFKPDGSATASTVYITDLKGTPKKYRVVVFNVTGSTYARQTW